MDIEAVQLLRNIELHTKIISFSLFFWLCVKIIGRLSDITTSWRTALNSRFGDSMYYALEEAKYSLVIEQCKKKLKKSPNHEDAHWHLARAYYHGEQYQLAKDQFEKVVYVVPRWKKPAKPFLKTINEKLKQNIK